jgi:hypothetical protein
VWGWGLLGTEKDFGGTRTGDSSFARFAQNDKQKSKGQKQIMRHEYFYGTKPAAFILEMERAKAGSFMASTSVF